MSLRYLNVVDHCRYVDTTKCLPPSSATWITAELKDHERIVKQIAKTSDSIYKKYYALKTDKIEEDIVLEKHIKPISGRTFKTDCQKYC